MGFSVDFYQEEKKNIRKTAILIIVFIAMMAFFGIIIDVIFNMVPIFTSIFLTIAFIQLMVSSRAGKKIVLKSVQAKELNLEDPEEKQVQNIVEEMSIAAGLAKPPEVYIMRNDEVLNAFATGTKREDSVICVTSGLLKKLNREETTGVIAHEMSHIVNRDVLLMTLISALLGAVVIIQIFAVRALWTYLRFGGFVRGGRKKKGDNSAMAILAFLGAVAGLSTVFAFVGRLSLLAVSRTREYFADARAIELTRDPTGLANALRKISSTSIKLKTASVATAHLFISDPLKRKINEKASFIASLWSTHPPTYMRIAILENRPPEEVKLELQD